MSIQDSFTLAQLKQLAPFRPDLAIFAERLLVASYSQFVDTLYKDLDACISYIEEDPKVRQKDGEDRLTSEIIGFLRSKGYDASHDEKIGGHSDIVVRHVDNYIWVAEAKIHSSYDYIQKGYNQLTTRYLLGTPNADAGAMLIYCRVKDTAGVMAQWLSNLQTSPPAGFSHSPCPTRQELGFYTTEINAGAGRPVKIRHIGIRQYWKPTL